MVEVRLDIVKDNAVALNLIDIGTFRQIKSGLIFVRVHTTDQLLASR